MLLLYIGTAELTHGLMANRKETLVTRALSDLVAQTEASTGVTDAEIDAAFSAASAIMSPFPTTTLRMTISSIEFVPDTSTPPVYTARVKWTAVSNSGATRPCGATAITQVANTATPTASTMPAGMYDAGTVIVADVTYLYDPPFGGQFLAWSSSQSGINFAATTYMKPRTQTEIAYNSATPPSGRTKCTYP